MNCFIHVGIRKAELCRIATGEPGEEAHNIFGAQRMKILMRLDPKSRRPERSEGEQSKKGAPRYLTGLTFLCHLVYLYC